MKSKLYILPTILLTGCFLFAGCGGSKNTENAETEAGATTINPENIGILEVVTQTSGSDQPYYEVVIDGDYEESIELSANGSEPFNFVGEGPYTVELLNIPDNCTVTGDNPREVLVPAEADEGKKTTTTFSIQCSE